MRKIIIIFISLILFIPNVFATTNAKTLGELKSELNALKNKKANQENEKKRTKNEIESARTNIYNSQKEITQNREKIENAKKEIEELNKDIASTKESIKKLINSYELLQGDNIYLEYIFEADSYTDFIYRYSVVSQLTEYNDNLMNELTKLVEELEKKKSDLSTKRSNLETESNNLNSKLITLRTNLDGYKELGTTIEEDIKDMKSEIKRLTNKGCKDNEDITTCGKTSQGGITLIDATGWSYPLSWGCVTSEYTGYNIRPDWSGGGGHHGIDLDCVNEGTTVYAASYGRVARVVNYSSCGGNMVWVYHSINGIPYTTVYMHLLRISVSPDQEVTPYTKIGEVGGGSTASYDGCTGGAHLHFGMAYGLNAYNFNANSFNPRNIINFPAIYYSGGGYFSR